MFLLSSNLKGKKLAPISEASIGKSSKGSYLKYKTLVNH